MFFRCSRAPDDHALHHPFCSPHALYYRSAGRIELPAPEAGSLLLLPVYSANLINLRGAFVCPCASAGRVNASAI